MVAEALAFGESTGLGSDRGIARGSRIFEEGGETDAADDGGGATAGTGALGATIGSTGRLAVTVAGTFR